MATISGIADREGWEQVFAHQIQHPGRPCDIAFGFIPPDGSSGNVVRALLVAQEMGLLTVALGRDDIGPIVAVDHTVTVKSANPQIVKEMEVTICHILWELVHAFLERPPVGGAAR